MNSNIKVWCERCSRLIKKTLIRRKSVVVVKLYTLFECFYGRFHKASKCPVWYSTLISSHIYNAAKRVIAKNSWQSYSQKFEVFFSRKQQDAIRTDWKIYSCIFYHLCIMVTIFQVANSLSIFQQQYLLWHNTENRWKVIIYNHVKLKKIMSPKDNFLTIFDFTLSFCKTLSQDG